MKKETNNLIKNTNILKINNNFYTLFLMFLILIFVSFIILPTKSFSQSQNHFLERDNIVKKYGNNQTLNISWYTEKRLDFKELLNNYLPISNSLSNIFSSNVVIIPDKDSATVAQMAINTNSFATYVNILDAQELIDKKWQPLLTTTYASPVVLLGKSQNNITNNNLKSKKILSNISHLSTIMKYSLKKQNLFNIENYKEEYVSDYELLNFLEDKNIDLVVVEESFAKNLIKNNPNTYNIYYNSTIFLNNIILLNPLYINNNSNINNIANGFLSINSLSNNDKQNIFGKQGTIFKQFDNKELVLANQIKISK